MKSKRRYLTMTALAALGLGGLAGGMAAAGPSGS